MKANSNSGKNRNVWLIVLCVFISILLPIFIQHPINVVFRDLFNPPGWKYLISNLRVISTLVCFAITCGIGIICLRFAKTKRWLFILHAILTFLWCVFIAVLFWIAVTD